MQNDRGRDPPDDFDEPVGDGSTDPATPRPTEGGDGPNVPPDEPPGVPPSPSEDPGSTSPHPAAERPAEGPNEPRDDDAVAPRPARRVGQVIAGRFILGSRLGVGGQGEVWRATQTVPFAREVAIKLLRPDLELDPERVERFRLEALRWALVPAGKGILPIYDFGEDEGRPFITMQLVEGYHLGQVIGQRRDRLAGRSLAGLHQLAVLDEADYLVSIATQFSRVARALQVAHNAHIIHRDLKPSNVLLDRDDESGIYLADFGLARNLDDVSHPGRTSVNGTPGYIAPERVLVGDGIDEYRCDVFSLGATLFQAATLGPAFPVRSDLPAQLEILRLAHAETPLPRKARPGLPRDLEAVILKAIDENPSRRYPTVAAFADDLDRFADGEPVEARPPGTLRRLARRLRRRPRVLATVGVLALIAGMAGLAIVADRVATERRVAELETEADRLLSMGDVEGAAEAAIRALELAPDHPRTAALADRVGDALIAEAHDAIDASLGGRLIRWLALVDRLGKLDRFQRDRFQDAVGLQELQIASDKPGTLVTFHGTTDDARPRPQRLLYGPIAAGSVNAPALLPNVVGGTYWVTAYVPSTGATATRAFVERHLVVPRGRTPPNFMPLLVLHPRSEAEATNGMIAMPGGTISRSASRPTQPKGCPIRTSRRGRLSSSRPTRSTRQR